MVLAPTEYEAVPSWNWWPRLPLRIGDTMASVIKPSSLSRRLRMRHAASVAVPCKRDHLDEVVAALCS